MKVNGFDSSFERGVIWPEGREEKLKGERGETGVESAELSGDVGREEVGEEGEEELKLERVLLQFFHAFR